MGNVLRFPGDATKSEFAEDVYNAILEGEKVAVAIKQSDGSVITGYHNLKHVDKQELVSHMQIDVIRDMFLATYEMQEIED